MISISIHLVDAINAERLRKRFLMKIDMEYFLLFDTIVEEREKFANDFSSRNVSP